jgi:hypothetical protein
MPSRRLASQWARTSSGGRRPGPSTPAPPQCPPRPQDLPGRRRLPPGRAGAGNRSLAPPLPCERRFHGSALTPGEPQASRRRMPAACVLHAGAPRAPGLEKSTQKITVPSQQTFSGSPRAADDHGIHVTSHSGQVIRLPTPGTPRLPQFQHSLGSAPCWLPLICFPPQSFPA